MIRSFANKDMEALFDDHFVQILSGFDRQARKKLLILNAAEALDDLRIPSGNRLDALSGSRKGQHSIRINGQWRICFIWRDGHVHDVEIVDYQ